MLDLPESNINEYSYRFLHNTVKPIPPPPHLEIDSTAAIFINFIYA